MPCPRRARPSRGARICLKAVGHTRCADTKGRASAQRVLQAGTFWLENADTTHGFRNPSRTEAAELWAVDIVPKKKQTARPRAATAIAYCWAVFAQTMLLIAVHARLASASGPFD